MKKIIDNHENMHSHLLQIHKGILVSGLWTRCAKKPLGYFMNI